MPILKVNGRYWALPTTSTMLKTATKYGTTLAPWAGAVGILGGYLMMDQWFYNKDAVLPTGGEEEGEEEE